jgi:hypothetical protein
MTPKNLLGKNLRILNSRIRLIFSRKPVSMRICKFFTVGNKKRPVEHVSGKMTKDHVTEMFKNNVEAIRVQEQADMGMIIYEESNEECEKSSVIVPKMYSKDALPSFSDAGARDKGQTSDGDQLPTNALGTKCNSQEKVGDYGLDLSGDSGFENTKRRGESITFMAPVPAPQ